MAAYWEEDWYRGLVLERRAQGALVRFVDYGNEDEMDDAVLRAATSVERAVPPLALPCPPCHRVNKHTHIINHRVIIINY